jgi:2-aminoadipate transaminase
MEPISFARGVPAAELIPASELAECAYAIARREGARLFSYGSGGGYEPLRAWVAEGHGVEAGRVVLTVGGLHGFGLYAAEQLSRRPGRVLVEGPSYDRPLKILARDRVEVVALAMDEEGLDPDAFEAEVRSRSHAPSFLYTIPTFQNPSGRTLSEERRRRIVEVASEYGVPVLEDDPYGRVRFEGDAPRTLHELEGGRLVTYTSSFSKTIAPGLRTGYFVLPAADAARFEERAVSTYIAPPLLPQAIIAEFVEQDRFEPNLAQVRSGLRARRDAMLEALGRSLPGGGRWNRPEGGYFVWLDFGEGVDVSELTERARREGVTFVPGADFFPPGPGLRLGASCVRLAFSYESPERIAQGIAVLAASLG